MSTPTESLLRPATGAALALLLPCPLVASPEVSPAALLSALAGGASSVAILFALAVVAGGLLLLVGSLRAPIGYEDASGFHRVLSPRRHGRAPRVLRRERLL